MQSTDILATIQANWPALAGAALLLLALVYWLLTRTKAPPRRREGTDVLSEGAARAQRNSALIEAPPAASLTPQHLPPQHSPPQPWPQACWRANR